MLLERPVDSSPRRKRKEKRGRSMLISTSILLVFMVVLLILGYLKGDGSHIKGLREGGKMFIDVIPLLIIGFSLGGLIQVMIPQSVINEFLGERSGVKGLLFASIAGGLTPGGPYVSFPIVAGLARSGVPIGPLVSYLAGWSLIAISRLPIEYAFLGLKFVIIRFLSTLIFPPLAGYMANTLFSRFY